jgi:integrase
MPRRSLPIRQLPSGRWQARPAGTDPATFDTYDDAEAWCLEQLSTRGRGMAPPRGTARVTFQEFGEEWAAAQPWAPRTRDRVRTNLHRHLYPRIGKVPIVRLRPTQLQALITSLATTQSPGTVALIHQHLCQVLNGAVADGIRPDNPAARLRLPRPDGEPLVIPTTEQVHRLAEAIDPGSRALVAVGAGLGLRQAEAFALTRDSVDFLRRVVHVRAQLRKTDQGKIVIDDTTKTGLARDVPLPDFVTTELASHLEHHDKGHPDGLIFTSRQGMKLRFDGWNDSIWKPATRAAGFDAGYHSLRHFCATTLLRRGVSVAAVAKTLGNTPVTVMRYYAHWIADDTELVRTVLDRALASPDNAARAVGAEGA